MISYFVSVWLISISIFLRIDLFFMFCSLLIFQVSLSHETNLSFQFCHLSWFKAWQFFFWKIILLNFLIFYELLKLSLSLFHFKLTFIPSQSLNFLLYLIYLLNLFILMVLERFPKVDNGILLEYIQIEKTLQNI